MKLSFLDKSGHISINSVAFVTDRISRLSLTWKMPTSEITNETFPYSLFSSNDRFDRTDNSPCQFHLRRLRHRRRRGARAGHRPATRQNGGELPGGSGTGDLVSAVLGMSMWCSFRILSPAPVPLFLHSSLPVVRPPHPGQRYPRI